MRSMSAKMDQPRPLSSSSHPWMHRGRQVPAPGTWTQQLTPVLTLQARWAETLVLHIEAIHSYMAERFKNSSIAVVFPWSGHHLHQRVFCCAVYMYTVTSLLATTSIRCTAGKTWVVHWLSGD